VSGKPVTTDGPRSKRLRPEVSRRILVVDDNEDNRDLFVRRLRRGGFEVVAVDDGPSALACLDDKSYDCVILDWMMPGMSGLEVLEAIREKHSKTALPVLMATAKRESGAVVEALELGANDYVTKPIDFPVLVARLETQLSVKHESAQASAPVIDMREGIPPGTVLDDRYEIGEQIGEGGFAAVYRARQISTGQHVAFKLLLPHRLRRARADVEVARFLREMKVIAELEHAHVVRLVDSGQLEVVHDLSPVAPPKNCENLSSDALYSAETRVEAACSGSFPREEEEAEGPSVGAVPYIVMEFLDGDSLARYLARRGRLEVSRAVDLMLPVISALGAAHRQGVVHRDVKPQNVLLVKDHRGERQPVVVDFGIAKLTGPDSDELTRTESFIGTPEYMAPEQARGKRSIDGRADQFSVAAMAYQALTGRKLYEAESLFEMIHKVATGAIKRPSALEVDIDPELEAVLLKALSTQPRDRYPSIEAFGRALLPHASDKSRNRWEESLSEGSSASTPPEGPANQEGGAETPMNDASSYPPQRTTAIDGLLRSTANGVATDTPEPIGAEPTERSWLRDVELVEPAPTETQLARADDDRFRPRLWVVALIVAIGILIAIIVQ